MTVNQNSPCFISFLLVLTPPNKLTPGDGCQAYKGYLIFGDSHHLLPPLPSFLTFNSGALEMPVAVSSRNEADPFAEFMNGPEDESPSEKSARLQREAEELKISRAIDEEIDQARVALKKEHDSTVKILLLGQSESGMQLMTSSLSAIHASR